MKKYIALVFILLLALFLRVWKIDQVPVSLFGDELDLGYHAYSILKTGRDYYGNLLPLHFHSLAEWRTPLYLYTAVPTVALFGVSELGVRLPAALFGVLGVLMTYILFKFVAFKYKFPVSANAFGLVSSFLLAISPWHIQYSRGGFEVTQMIFFFLAGLYFFFKTIDNKGKLLWVSVVCFLLMPWGYSTAKLFTPILLLLLTVVYRKELFKLPRKSIIFSIFAGLVLGLPLLYTIFTGTGSQRFEYVGIFNNESESLIAEERSQILEYRGVEENSPVDRLVTSKYTGVGNTFINNYLSAFSTEFLFLNGDPNMRHSIPGQGMLYVVEAVSLLVGVVLFFSSQVNKKLKLVIGGWLTLGVLPSAITLDGGTHATRLILILPALIFIISYGLLAFRNIVSSKAYATCLVIYSLVLMIGFFFYQYNYWNLYPWDSERWWHAGWEEAISSVKEFEGEYENVVISTKDEPPWIFFVGWYAYDPRAWQDNFPIGNDVEFDGLGKVSHTGKFYFGHFEGGLYEWGKVLGSDTLFLATAKDVSVDLIAEPNRTPSDLTLIKSIALPSGEPGFYLFTGTNE